MQKTTSTTNSSPETASDVQDDPSLHGLLEMVNLPQHLESSRLFTQLRDHHVRSRLQFTGPGNEEALEADRLLSHRLQQVAHQLEKKYGFEKKVGKNDFAGNVTWLQQFRNCMRDAFTMSRINQPMLSPMGQYILAREGFNPNIPGIKITLGPDVFDEFGFVKSDILSAMVKSRRTLLHKDQQWFEKVIQVGLFKMYLI
jgi:hypothetical protein